MPEAPVHLMPQFTLTAAGSGRIVDLHRPPAPLLLLFHDQTSADAAVAINLAVRAQVADASHLLIASVADMSSIPRLFRPLAQTALDKGYEDAAQRLPDDLDPAAYILILPDWDGAVTQHTGFTQLDRQPGMLLVDVGGQVLGKYQGPHPTDQALAWLAPLNLSTG